MCTYIYNPLKLLLECCVTKNYSLASKELRMGKLLGLVIMMMGVEVALITQLGGAKEVALNETCFDGGVDVGVGLGFYQSGCPEAEAIIFAWVETAISEDPRMAASLLRLHFHDCFVNASQLATMH